MRANGPARFPLGIDLVELRGAKAFYRDHRDRLRDFFSEEEEAFIRRDARPSVALAKLLALKEAVFKAVSPRWVGPSLFGRIRILPSGRSRFTCRVARSRARSLRMRLEVETRAHYVLARCVGIS